MNLWKKKQPVEQEIVPDKNHNFAMSIQNLLNFLTIRETKLSDAIHRIVLIDGQITELYKNVYVLRDQLKTLSGGGTSIIIQKKDIIVNLSSQYKSEYWREFTLFALDNISTVLPVLASTSKIMREEAGNAEQCARIARSFATKIQDNLNLGISSVDLIMLRSFNDQVAEFDGRVNSLQLTTINMDTDLHELRVIFQILKTVNTRSRHNLQNVVLQSLQILLKNIDLMEEYTKAVALILNTKIMDASPLLGPDIFDLLSQEQNKSSLENLENENL